MRAFNILIFGGVADAYALAERIADDRPDWRVVTSLAGRTRAPRKPAGELRVGGYGGPNLLAAYLGAEGLDVVVDAAHPFAERIAANVAAACGVAERPRLKLQRPGFDSPAAATAIRSPSLAAAATLPPTGARVFLALGAGGAQAFKDRDDLRIAARTRAPARLHARGARPWRYVVGAPSACVEDERAMLEASGAEWLVARDSGGAGGAKLTAAAALGLKIVLIDRPAPPPGPLVETVDDALDWLHAQATAGPGPRPVQARDAAAAVARLKDQRGFGPL